MKHDPIADDDKLSALYRTHLKDAALPSSASDARVLKMAADALRPSPSARQRTGPVGIRSATSRRKSLGSKPYVNPGSA